jgi:hypothetical protein
MLPAAKLTAALLTGGCVSELQYEEARSAAEVEGEARRRAALELDKARADVQRLQDELRARDEALKASDGTLHEVKFEQDRVAKQRDESAVLVEQLRGELARVGGHLQASVEEKSRLERELMATRNSGDTAAAQRVELVRDLALAVGGARLEDAVGIEIEDNDVVVRVRSDAIFERDGAGLRPTLGPLLGSIASPDLLLKWSATIREADVDPELPQELGEARRNTLRSLIADRVGDAALSYEAGATGTPRSYEVVLEPLPSEER